MVSLKLTPKAKKEQNELAEYKPPEYGYGTQISLEDDQLKKLGLSSDMKVGTELEIKGKVTVKGLQKSAGEHGEHESLQLQITDMDIVSGDDDDADDKGLAKKMYANPPKATPYGK